MNGAAADQPEALTAIRAAAGARFYTVGTGSNSSSSIEEEDLLKAVLFVAIA